VIFLLIICVAPVVLGQQRGAPATVRDRTFVSKTHGFSIEVPTGWHVATGKSDDLPLFANFPWSNLQSQGTLPKGGATMHILSEADLPTRHRDYSLDKWAEFDERSAIPETIVSHVFEMPGSSEVTRALLVSYDEATDGSPSPQQRHDVTIYWEFHRAKFATHLFYVVGDPNGQRYETELGALMRSLKPLPRD